MPKNGALVAKIGVDPAENGPFQSEEALKGRKSDGTLTWGACSRRARAAARRPGGRGSRASNGNAIPRSGPRGTGRRRAGTIASPAPRTPPTRFFALNKSECSPENQVDKSANQQIPTKRRFNLRRFIAKRLQTVRKKKCIKEQI